MALSKFDQQVKDTLANAGKGFLQLFSKEEQDVIKTDNTRCRVRSAAGGGKTTLIAARYAYLTQMKGVDSKRICVLSFNKENIESFKNKLDEWGISNFEKSDIRTFHALALQIIYHANPQVWPTLLEELEEPFTKRDRVDHNKGVAFMYQFEKKAKEHYSFLEEYSSGKTTGKYPNNALSMLLDRNNHPGSCRSHQEKVIFEYLAQNGYDFAYEEVLKKDTAWYNRQDGRYDFVLYKDNKPAYILEHYACDKDFSEEIKGSGTDYSYHSREKHQALLRDFPDHYLYTFGKDVDETMLEKEIQSLLSQCGFTPTRTQQTQAPKSPTPELVKLFSFFIDSRNLILERGAVPSKVFKNLKEKEESNNIIQTLCEMEDVYDGFLNEKNTYTDFAQSLKRAAEECKRNKRKLSKDHSYDYIMVDEFQDLSQLKYNLLQGLLQINPNANLLVVGDDRQSIYSFAQCDPGFFQNFKDLFSVKGSDKQPLLKDLSVTRRFGGELIEISNLFCEMPVQKGAKIKTKVVLVPISALKKDGKYSNEEREKIRDTTMGLEDCLALHRFRDRDIDNVFDNSTGKHHKANTMHAAKGTEADYTFLMNCNDGAIPYIRGQSCDYDTVFEQIRHELGVDYDDNFKEQEERRLFYVALTRAKEGVYIYYQKDSPSPFVKEIMEWKSQASKKKK